MKLSPAAIVNMGVQRQVAANALYTQLAADVDQITSHNSDANNVKIDPAPFTTALAAGQQIVNQLASHVAAVTKPQTT